MYQNKQAFTLIELLVVVLIIGILAAVALPQYELAVKKSRFIKAMPLVKSIKDAEEVFYVANGYYTGVFDELDLSVAGSENDKSYYNVEGGGIDIFNGSSQYITEPDSPDAAVIFWNNAGSYVYFLEHSAYPNQRFCLGNEKVCKSMGGEEFGTLFTVTAWRLP